MSDEFSVSNFSFDLDNVSVLSFECEQALSITSNVSSQTSSTRQKLSACIITIFPPDAVSLWLLPNTYFDNTEHIAYWCGQFEQTPTTNNIHAHIYLEWHREHRQRFEHIRKAFSDKLEKGVDIKPTKRLSANSRQCAINYVLKPDTFINVPNLRYVWEHCVSPVSFNANLFKKKVPPLSSKSKLEEQRRSHIESKPRWWTWDQIVHENDQSKALLCTCSWGKPYHAGRIAEIHQRSISKVIIYYGAGGTGKTTMAINFDTRDTESQNERYYRRNVDDGHFWGSGRTAYKGQRVVHFEEFCGQESLSRIKEICDLGKPGPNVNIKNGGTTLNHETVIFTSNHHPAGWYKNVWTKDPKQFHPFWRRVTQILFFPPFKEDGSLNTPDVDTTPYFIDQTDQWRTLDGSYDNALQHASTYWPLRDETENFGATSPNFHLP